MKKLFILSLLLFSFNGWADLTELTQEELDNLFGSDPYHLCVRNGATSTFDHEKYKSYPCVKDNYPNFDGSIECFSGSKKVHSISDAAIIRKRGGWYEYMIKDFWGNVREGEIIANLEVYTCKMVEPTTQDACIDEKHMEIDMDNCKNKDYKE